MKDNLGTKIRVVFFCFILCMSTIFSGCLIAKDNTTSQDTMVAEDKITAQDKTTAEDKATLEDNTTSQEESTEQSTTVDSDTEVGVTTTEKEVEEKLAAMSLHEKICQLFIITPEALTGETVVTSSSETARVNMEKYPVGGLIFFASNIKTPEQVTDMLIDFQRYSVNVTEIPLFTCIDEEGGRVARIGKNENFNVKKIKPMSQVTSVSEAYDVGATIGAYLKKYGFNVDFVPVADVITNEKNNVIGDRSFGTDKDIVATYAAAVSAGLQSEGVLSTFKHFPGHGATEGDTHEGFAFTNKTYEEMKGNEFVPFMLAQEKGVDMVMVAHISTPAIIGDNTPCSLSYKMITEILKGDLGYKGLVITDALNMGAIKNEYGAVEAVIMAVKAGVDILLMPEDFKECVAALENAVENGEITEERIDESVRKILMKKYEK